MPKEGKAKPDRPRGTAAWLDRAAPVRKGEEVDQRRLETFLREQLPEAGGELTVEQFPSGFSNLTYLVRLGTLELVLRRPPFGTHAGAAHDMGREYKFLARLHPVYPKAPRPLLYCDEASILGAPFYVMERVRGVILRRRLPEGLELGPWLARRLSEAFVDNLARLHLLDHRAAGLESLGRPEGYVERQIRGWVERYRRSATDRWEGLERTIEWLLGSRPAESGAAIIHNDYKYDNVVLDPRDLTQIRAVLDWEMCTVGDPLMDLGSTLAYWVEATDDPRWQAVGFGPTAVAGSLTRLELACRYAERTGASLEDLLFYFVYGLLKLAVIVQQIYDRYRRGLTQDRRFEPLGKTVGLLGEVAARAIDRQRV